MATLVNPNQAEIDYCSDPEGINKPMPEPVTVNCSTCCWNEQCPIIEQTPNTPNNPETGINAFFSSLSYGNEPQKTPEEHILFEEHQFLITGILLANQMKNYPESIRTSLLEANRIHLRNLIELFRLSGKKSTHSFEMPLQKTIPSFTPQETDDIKQNLPDLWKAAMKHLGNPIQNENICWRVIFSLISNTTDHCGEDRFKDSELKQRYIYKNNTIKYMVSAIRESVDEMKENVDGERLSIIRHLLEQYK